MESFPTSPPLSSSEMGSPRQVSKSHFKAHALELFRQVEASGQPLVVTDHGRPSVEVRPYRPAEPSAADPLDALRGSVLLFDEPFEPVGENDWEALA
ncbi:MAG: type II toxin-antitoxin system Phd/YefM family antitoxin [Cyanobium sp.]